MNGRHAWVRRLGPWVGIGTSPAALMTGGGLSVGHDGMAVIVLVLGGTVLLTVLAVAQGVLGVRERRALGAVVARALPGAAGQRMAALTMLAMMVGWFGVNVDVGGTALARLLGLPGPAGMALFGGIALLATVRGLGALSWTALVTGTATVVLAGWGLALAAERAPLGFDSASVQPQVGALTGLSVVVGYGAAFALRTPDFTLDLPRSRDVMACGVVGLGLPLIVFAVIGAVLQASTGHWNIADVLTDLQSPVAGQAFVAVGFLGSVMTNLHSGRLAFATGTGMGSRIGVWAVAAAGLALAVSGFGGRMINFMVLLAVVVPGLIVVCVAAASDRSPARSAWAWIWAASCAVGLAVEYLPGGGGVLAATGTAVAGAVAVRRSRGRRATA